jgi:hypothetical protein
VAPSLPAKWPAVWTRLLNARRRGTH